MTDTPKLHATGTYRWCRHKDGRVQLQRGWAADIDGPYEWRLAPPGSPEPPKVLDSEGEWIGD